MARFGQALKPSKVPQQLSKASAPHNPPLALPSYLPIGPTNCFYWASKLLHGTFWPGLKTFKSPAAAQHRTAQPVVRFYQRSSSASSSSSSSSSSSTSCPLPPRPPPRLLLLQFLLDHVCINFHLHFRLSNSSPSSLPSLFAKLFANFPAQCAPLNLNLGPSQLSVHRWTSTWDLPSPVCTAGPQPGTFPAQCAPLDLNLGPAQLSVHRWTSTAK